MESHGENDGRDTSPDCIGRYNATRRKVTRCLAGPGEILAAEMKNSKMFTYNHTYL